MQHRPDVGQALLVQRHHCVDGVSGNTMIFHVKANEHVLLGRQFHEVANVLHALFRVDEQAEGGGFDADVGVKIIGPDGLHDTNVFLEKEGCFVHG